MSNHHDTPRDDTPVDHTAPPGAFVLVALAAGFGIIGMAIGFATILGVTATASGGHDTTAYGPAVVSAISSLVLGVLLVAGAALVWRAHRRARIVLGTAVILLLAMVAAIGLTLRRRKDARYSDASAAVRTRAADRLRIVRIPARPRDAEPS